MQDRLSPIEVDGLLRRAFPTGGEWPRRDGEGHLSWPPAWTKRDRADWHHLIDALEPWPSAEPEEPCPPLPALRVRQRVKLISPVAVALIGAGAGALTIAQSVW